MSCARSRVVAAHLVRSGQVSNIGEAVALMKKARPQVDLSNEQRALLDRMTLTRGPQ
jgi:protein-tyrosine phosphatase